MRKFRRIIVFILILLIVPVSALHADLVITEIMGRSNHNAPTDCDWWELTNTGPNTINLSGYSWDDDHQRVGMNVFPDIFIIAANECRLRRCWGLIPLKSRARGGR